MEYREHIARVIEYIEENLQSEISLAQCARVSGYSAYHFLRVFKDTVGLTPADYIRKRRISEISREIMQGNRYISDIAFRYGFNSKENFVRAFKAEHHILPTEYKEARNSLKLYGRFRFGEGDFSVMPRIVEIQPFLLTVYPCDEDRVPNFWNKYNARGLSLKLSGGREVWDYGVSSWNHEENRLDYFLGIRSEFALGDIQGTWQLPIAGGSTQCFPPLPRPRRTLWIGFTEPGNISICSGSPTAVMRAEQTMNLSAIWKRAGFFRKTYIFHWIGNKNNI